MTIRGYQKPLYILPFDHRGSFETGMFGWKGALDAEQTAQIAAAKQVIYDGFQQAVAGGVPKEKAGILVDEQFGTAILRDATEQGYTTACPAERSGQDEFDFEYGDLQRQMNLRRGEAYARIFAHRFDHILEQALEFGLGDSAGINRIGGRPNNRMTEACNLENHTDFLNLIGFY